MMARPTLRLEIAASIFGALATGPALYLFTQLFARKGLHVSGWMLSVLVAQMSFGHFLAGILARHSHGRRRVPIVSGAYAAAALCLLAIALLPVRAASAVPYVLILLGPALLNTLLLSVRSTIWHSNYNERIRGRMVSRLGFVTLAAAAVSVQLSCWALNDWPKSGLLSRCYRPHQVVYILAAICALIAAGFYSRIRVRRERRLLREGAAGSGHMWSSLRVLWVDRPYRRFMLCQFLSGSSVFLTLPVITLIMTDDRYFGVNYVDGATAMSLSPFLAALALVGLAGHLFDHMSITRYRAINAAAWASSRALLLVATLLLSWPLVLIAFACQGAGMASGRMAFTIGHTRFAAPGQGQRYMDAHLFLAGVRGLAMPFVGIWLYENTSLGVWTLGVSAAMQFAASIAFALSPAPPDRPTD